MKIILLFAFALCSFNANSQNIQLPQLSYHNDKVYYADTLKSVNVSDMDIARQWIEKKYSTIKHLKINSDNNKLLADVINRSVLYYRYFGHTRPQKYNLKYEVNITRVDDNILFTLQNFSFEPGYSEDFEQGEYPVEHYVEQIKVTNEDRRLSESKAKKAELSRQILTDLNTTALEIINSFKSTIQKGSYIE